MIGIILGVLMDRIVRSCWRVLVCIMDFFLEMFHIGLKDEQRAALYQFVKFGIIGVSNTVISYAVYLAVLLPLQQKNWFPRADYIIANAVAFVISVFWSFCWNRRYVFTAGEGEHIPYWRALIKTYISYAFTGLFLNTVLSILWVRLLGVPKAIAPIFNLLLSVPINFLMNKYWAFRKEKGNKKQCKMEE